VTVLMIFAIELHPILGQNWFRHSHGFRDDLP